MILIANSDKPILCFGGSTQEPFQRPFPSFRITAARHSRGSTPQWNCPLQLRLSLHLKGLTSSFFSHSVSITCWLSPFILPSEMSRNHLCVGCYPAVKASAISYSLKVRYLMVWGRAVYEGCTVRSLTSHTFTFYSEAVWGRDGSCQRFNEYSSSVWAQWGDFKTLDMLCVAWNVFLKAHNERNHNLFVLSSSLCLCVGYRPIGIFLGWSLSIFTCSRIHTALTKRDRFFCSLDHLL